MRPVRSQSLGTFSGPHKATDTAQAVILLQKLLSCVDKHWEAIVASCVVPWIPDHEAQPAEVPAEAAGLKDMIAELHSRCLSSDEFDAAIQNQACCLTPKQAERLQVLLYAVEDFEFADYLHLAIFHTSNRFVESPLGISPRSWDHQGPAVPIHWTTVHRFLPDSYVAARHHISRREQKKSRATVSGIINVETDADKEIGQATCPQMEKWLQMMQKGGLPRQRTSDIAYLKAKAHQRYQDAHARKSISLRNTQPRPQQDSPNDQQMLPELAIDSCRPRDALLHGWNKRFPGEGAKFPSVSRLCFTGLQNAAWQRKSRRVSTRPVPVQPELSKGSSLQYPSAHSIAAASRDNAAPAEASTHSEQQLVEPESFSNMQLMQMQQRQQQLLQHRLAVYQPSSVHAYQSGLQPQAAARKQQQLLPHIHSCSGALDVDMGVLDQPQGRAAPPDLLQSHGRTSPKSFQTFTEREPVADSPITLFSLGSPYSSSSPWGSTATAINSTTSPNEWAKLMAVKSMVGSVLVGKGSKAAPPSREGSADFTKGPLKGHASRPSSSMPLPNEATPKSASAAPKAGRRAVFSQEAIKMGSEGANDITRKLAGATTSSSSAAMQSSGEDTESVRSSAAEVGFAEEKVLTAGHESRSDADQQGMQQQALSVSAEADLDQGKLSAANRTESYAFNRSLSSVRPRRDSIPTASPLSRVVTYRPEMLRAAYQPPAVSDLSQSRVQDSMWEENPVAATLRYCGMTAEQREKQVEFAAQLGQWYKEQLQRRVPSRNTGVRTVTLVD